MTRSFQQRFKGFQVACLILLFNVLSLDQPQLPGRALPSPHLRDRALFSPAVAPACATSSAGASATSPMDELLQWQRMPLLWPGIVTGTQSSAHERESDFSSWLYAEGDRLYFFDQTGPLCLTRAFATSSGALAEKREARFFQEALLHIEVDGDTVVSVPFESVFNGTLASLFPPPLVSSIPAHFLLAGVVLQVPLCATARLRLSWAFPFSEPRTLLRNATQALEDADACVSTNSLCALVVYFDTNFVRFPGVRLPHGWQPFSATTRLPPTLASSLNPASHLARLHAASDSGLSVHTCSVLTPTAPNHTLLLTPPGSQGTVLALLLNFTSTPLGAGSSAHSPHLLLEAHWDEGEEGGGGVLRATLEALFGPPFLSFAEHAIHTPHTANLVLGTYGVNTSASDSSSSSGSGIGSGSGSSQSVGGPSGAYLALPAPFWHSARVTLTLLPGSDQESIQVCSSALVSGVVSKRSPLSSSSHPQAGGESSSSPSCSSGLGEAAWQEEAPVGYLQGDFYDLYLAKGVENVLGNVSGKVGKLVLVTNHLEARHGVNPLSLVEGDMRVTIDGRASPSAWDSGFEDFFSGAHAYQYAPTGTSAPLFSHYRHVTPRIQEYHNGQCEPPENPGCVSWVYANEWPHGDLLSQRTLLLDAMPFNHDLLLTLEGFPAEWGNGRVKGAVLFYGVNARRPPGVMDTLVPSEELYLPWGQRAHGYRVVRPVPSASSSSFTSPPISSPIPLYSLTSAFAGGGEPPSVDDFSCPVLRTGYSSQEFGDYQSCPAALHTHAVLPIPLGTTLAFELALDPRASHCSLRRLVDAAHSVQLGVLVVDGEVAGRLGSSDRAFSHLNTRWRELESSLPKSLTRGKSRVKIEVRVEEDAGSTGRVYPNAQVGGAWTEVQWQSMCYYQ